jgi:hypothetical protein
MTDDPFEDFETMAEILAFVHQQCGIEGVETVLSGSDTTQRDLVRAADEPEQAGLIHVADAVMALADQAPATTDAPYSNSSGDFRDWFRRQHNRFPTPEETPKGLS